jgi:hypothetical protein
MLAERQSRLEFATRLPSAIPVRYDFQTAALSSACGQVSKYDTGMGLLPDADALSRLWQVDELA